MRSAANAENIRTKGHKNKRASALRLHVAVHVIVPHHAAPFVQVSHHGVAHQFAHGHKPFARHAAPLHFGCAVRHIIAHVAQFVHQGDGLFGQTAVRGAASCLRCTVSVVAHAFLRLGGVQRFHFVVPGYAR